MNTFEQFRETHKQNSSVCAYYLLSFPVLQNNFFLLWLSITHDNSIYVYIFYCSRFFTLILLCVCVVCMCTDINSWILIKFFTINTKFIWLDDNYSLRFIRIICMCDVLLLSNNMFGHFILILTITTHAHTQTNKHSFFFLPLCLCLSHSLCLKEFVSNFPLSLSFVKNKQ